MDTIADGGTAVDPTDRDTLRSHLERFAGTDRVSETGEGTLTAEFSAATYVSVDTDGRVSTGMPLHSFDAPADRLRFDHDAGECHVTAGGVSYTFRRP